AGAWCWSCRASGRDDVVGVDAGGHDVFGVDGTGLDDAADLDDGGGRRGGHDGAEVAGGLAVDEVAGAVGGVGLDEGDVGGERLFEDVPLSVDDAGLLALGEHGAVAGAGEEAADAGAAGADAFGE